MRLFQMNLSDWSLLAVNAATIVVAILQQWNLLTLMWVYWIQSAILYVFSYLRVRKTSIPDNLNSIAPNILNHKTFFLFFFGAFNIGLLEMLLLWPTASEQIQVDWAIIAVVAAAYFINHAISYWGHQNEAMGEFMNTMLTSAWRIIPIYVTLLFAMFWFEAVDQQLSTLALFLTLKIIPDILTHKIQHPTITST